MTEGPWFPSKRERTKHYPEWANFARSVPGGDNDPSLWHLITSVAKRQPDPNHMKAGIKREAATIPWVTFVLGSGCLTASDTVAGGDSADDVERAVTTALTEASASFPELALDQLAVEYLGLLVREKTGIDDLNDALSTIVVRDDINPQDYSAMVALAAALSTQLYASILNSSQHILGRADREEVSFYPDTPGREDVRVEIIEPLTWVLDRLVDWAENKDAQPPQKALRHLAAAVKVSVGRFALRRMHVELLTAFAWYFFTAGTRVYPGWSEMMLLRTFDNDDWFRDEIMTSGGLNPRPEINAVTGHHNWVAERIVEVTNQSWESRRREVEATNASDAGATERDRFYDLVAEYLWQQAEAVLPADAKAPQPTCFVTSFDLELEMALWSLGKPFIVMLPVFAVEPSRPNSASLKWVWTIVSPEKSSTATRDPESKLTLPIGLAQPGGWAVLTENTFKAKSRRRAQHHDRDPDGAPHAVLPIVVRITGSPLMQTPTVEDVRPTTETNDLHHALLLDEYTAIQQSALDLAGAAGGDSGWGFPPFLTASAGGPSRFWMLMGTQLGDTGVRLRLTAQQIAARVARDQDNRVTDEPESESRSENEVDTPDPEDGPAEHDDGDAAGRTAGILINDKSQTNDRELFLWQDFDVIDGRHVDRMADLRALYEKLDTEFAKIRAGVEALQREKRK